MEILVPSGTQVLRVGLDTDLDRRCENSEAMSYDSTESI